MKDLAFRLFVESGRDYPPALVFTPLVLLTEPFSEGLNLIKWDRTDSGSDQSLGLWGVFHVGQIV